MNAIKNPMIFALWLAVLGCTKDEGDTDTDADADTDSDADTDTDSDADTDVEPAGFTFATDDPDAYTRVDRMAMPAVATAVITSKDAYNAADPTDDAAGDFVGEITTNVTALHAALDDDLTSLGLVPCAAASCVSQAAPLVVPDTIAVNTATAAGFPNGRRLQDQVIDVTLAVVLLDLSASGQTVTTFAGLPLNPAANDETFGTTFPYLAPAH